MTPGREGGAGRLGWADPRPAASSSPNSGRPRPRLPPSRRPALASPLPHALQLEPL